MVSLEFIKEDHLSCSSIIANVYYSKLITIDIVALSCVDHLTIYNSSGKPQKSLPDLLREFNLPPGLFPQNIICYEFDASKAKLVVYLPSACEICFKDSSIVRYGTRIKATLSRGKLTGIEGMKTKVLVWVKVTSIHVEGHKSDKIWFTAGVKKSRAKDAYEMPRDAIKVEEF